MIDFKRFFEKYHKQMVQAWELYLLCDERQFYKEGFVLGKLKKEKIGRNHFTQS